MLVKIVSSLALLL